MSSAEQRPATPDNAGRVFHEQAKAPDAAFNVAAYDASYMARALQREIDEGRPGAYMGGSLEDRTQAIRDRITQLATERNHREKGIFIGSFQTSAMEIIYGPDVIQALYNDGTFVW